MSVVTVAIDLAKTVFELAGADRHWRVIERRRFTRVQLARYFENSAVEHVVMEACSSAHHWGRMLRSRGIRVSLLPPHYVRAYVRRNKTDQADATALLEAARASDIVPVQVKSLEQQALQGLHRVRSGWLSTRTARINALRGLCREFGLIAPVGSRKGLRELSQRLEDPTAQIPPLLVRTLRALVEEVRSIEQRLAGIEAELRGIAAASAVCQRLLTIPGVGLISATAFAGAVADISSFRSARHFACWLGLTPREHSSGHVRRLGSISKRGNAYLRTLLVHGGRAVLYSAAAMRRGGRPLDALRHWGLEVMGRTTHNKAAVAIANKLARIIWAAWRRERDFEARAPLAQAA